MKVFFIIMINVLLVYSPILSLNDDVAENIASAIRIGNYKELTKYFNSTIDLALPEKEGVFSKTQAELIMKDFFFKNPPKSFLINNQGTSKNGSLFFVGTLTTSTNTFRIYFLIKKNVDTYKIQQLQIEIEKSIK